MEYNTVYTYTLQHLPITYFPSHTRFHLLQQVGVVMYGEVGSCVYLALSVGGPCQFVQGNITTAEMCLLNFPPLSLIS